MQIDRLLEIVLILLDKKQVPAKALAERFHVSTRTIYRDMDALTLAGIPVYAVKGKGGGIALMEGYTLDRSLLSQKEQGDILYALESLSVTQFPEMQATLEKVSRAFRAKATANWIEVDFSSWDIGPEEQEKFSIFKEALLQKRVIIFDYYNASGTQTSRRLEPLKLTFKSRAWYLFGYCQEKADFRLFRVSRIRSLRLTGDFFDRAMPEAIQWDALQPPSFTAVRLALRFAPEASYRVYDDFSSFPIQREADGSLLVEVEYPFDEWVIGFLLSFGDSVEVLEPPFVRGLLTQRAQRIVEKYGRSQ